MSDNWKMNGKTFLITGAASGLGAQYAETFLQEGAKKVAVLDVAEEQGKATVERLNQSYPDAAKFYKCDVSNEAALSSAFEQVLADFGTVDVIINNAGIMSDAPGAWRKACDVNWQGLVSFTMKGLQHMRKGEGGEGGTIINISSTAALCIWPLLPIYSASKMAVLHFSQCLAQGLSDEIDGVRILTICFGPTDTALMQNLTERSIDEKVGQLLDVTTKGSTLLQKIESAVKAFVEMFKTATNGTVWLATNDRPVKNITPTIEKAFKDIEGTWNY